MKKQHYIMAAMLIGGLCLTGCENEDMARLGDTDGNGIEVPEGYAVVNFPTDGTQTRAAASGKRAIAYVDLLLYEEQDDHTFTLYKQENKFTEASTGAGSEWPLTIASETLPIGKTYKAVFLGNVNNNYSEGAATLEGVSDGSKFDDARIKKQDGKEFTEKNMPYMDVAEFTVESGGNDVPVMLKRIVSRHSIAGAGVSDSYYENLLADGQALGEQIFGSSEDTSASKDEKSLLWQCFFKQLMRDFIFPTAYMLKGNDVWNEQSELARWWTENESDFWNNYSDKYPDDASIKILKGSLKQAEGLYEWTSDTQKKQALLSLVCDMFSNKDACIDKMLACVKQNDIPQLVDGSASGQTGSYSLAVTAVAKQLETALPSSSLFPWESATSAKIILSEEPSALDFNWTVLEWNSNIQEKKVALSGGGTDEKTLDLLLLGTAEQPNGENFGFSSLYKNTENDLTLPSDFPGQPLLANVSTIYRITPDELPQWDGELVTDTEIPIYFSYGKIAEILTGEGGITSLGYEDLIEKKSDTSADTPFRFALLNAYDLTRSEEYFSLTTSNGYVYGVILSTGMDQFKFQMQIPSFEEGSSVTTRWTYESSKD